MSVKITNYKTHFEGKIEKITETGCWIWLGALQGKYYKELNGGYGSVRYYGKVTPAHIAYYKEFKGEIPKGLHIDHLCRVTCCVNPDHLEPVLPLENWNRGINNKGDHQKSKTHCPHGHEYTEQNTMYDSKANGLPKYRRCRACYLHMRRNGSVK